MNAQVTEFLTQQDKWKTELSLLREIMLSTGLDETYKWKQPCYCIQGKNVAIIGGFKSDCFVSFFNGALLQDDQMLLVKPGENSIAGRMIKFQSLEQIEQHKDTIRAYTLEAAEAEKQGIKVEPDSKPHENPPPELLEAFNSNEALKNAFEALTPGRQRAYNMFFASAKQEKTRFDRIKKFENRILKGYGMNDCVCGKSKRMPNCDGSHKYAD